MKGVFCKASFQVLIQKIPFWNLSFTCVDNESFYLCVHNRAEVNQNHQLDARGGQKQPLCGLQAPEQQQLRAGVPPRAAATG